MQTAIGNRTLTRVAGGAGIAGQIAAAFFYILVPALTVPSPENYIFPIAWVVLVGFAIGWWRHHPWRSFLVPIVSVPAVLLVLQTGQVEGPGGGSAQTSSQGFDLDCIEARAKLP